MTLGPPALEVYEDRTRIKGDSHGKDYNTREPYSAIGMRSAVSGMPAGGDYSSEPEADHPTGRTTLSQGRRMTAPPFITNTGLSTVAMSVVGSPANAARSAA